jgi:autotransporter-associated beta strand protein
VTLSGGAANTYSGLTTVSAGTLTLNKTAGVNAIVGDGVSSKSTDDILVNGGTLLWSANDQVADSVRINVTTGTVNFGSANETLYDLENSGGTVNYGTGNVTITDPTWSGGTNEIHGNTSFGVLNVSGGTNTVFGAAGPGGGPGTLTIGSGGLNFSGTASPNITVNSDAGTPGKIVLAGNVTSTVTSGTASITSGGVATNPGQLDLNGATRTFTVGNGTAATDMSISAQIIGAAGGLTKAGAGALALTGANTYGGGTVVSAGSLFINNTTGSGTGTGSVTVNNSGSTLGGTGTIGGSVTVNAGANIAPGNGGNTTAILSTGALTLASTSNFLVDLNGMTVGTQYDQLAVTGLVTLTGSNLVVTLGMPVQVGNTYTIISNDGTDPITTMFAQGSTVSSGGNTFSINYAGGDGNDVTLTVTAAVPEPSTWVGGALAFAALVYMKRRHFARLLKRKA